MISNKKREQVAVALINEMFKIAGHDITFDNIKGRQDNWYQQWTMTVEQNNRWKEWGTNYIKKELRLSKRFAEKEMNWFSLNYGLKFEDFENEIK